MELYEGLLTRRSIRKYNPEKKLSDEQIIELLRAASYAPSAHNKQPWHFLVLKDAETLRTLRQLQPWTSFAKDMKLNVSTAKKKVGIMRKLMVLWLQKTFC